jgi:hypothetical protein
VSGFMIYRRRRKSPFQEPPTADIKPASQPYQYAPAPVTEPIVELDPERPPAELPTSPK